MIAFLLANREQMDAIRPLSSEIPANYDLRIFEFDLQPATAYRLWDSNPA
jgi:hypothetical protein